MLKFLNHATALILALVMTACVYDDDQPSVCPPDGNDDPAMVSLIFSVAALDSDAPQSRAPEVSDTTYFENAISDYENIHTLRIILVRPNGYVEHNMGLTHFADGVSTDHVNNIVMKVHSGEDKQVFVIANEESVDFDFSSAGIPVGVMFPFDDIEKLQLKASEPGKPLYDNTGTAKSYLPMSEQFLVHVDEPAPDQVGDFYQYAKLFVTRTTVKFTVTAKAEATNPNQFEIVGITFNKIGNTQYLFPKNTVYDSPKYPISSDPRFITAYDVPADTVNTVLSLPLPEGGWVFRPNSGDEHAMTPALYFPETAIKGDYTVTVSVRFPGIGDEPVDLTAKLPNLPSLPRNTHVKINLSFGEYGIKCIVDVVPYTQVTLDPVFGFDELDPGIKKDDNKDQENKQ